MEKQVTIILPGPRASSTSSRSTPWLITRRNSIPISRPTSPPFHRASGETGYSPELEEKMKKTLATFGETFKATKGLN
jgi:F-type H+-transporting ATPase subunit alpha